MNSLNYLSLDKKLEYFETQFKKVEDNLLIIANEIDGVKTVSDLVSFEIRLMSELSIIEGLKYAGITECLNISEFVDKLYRMHENLLSRLGEKKVGSNSVGDDSKQTFIKKTLDSISEINSSFPKEEVGRILAVLMADKTNNYAKFEASVMMYKLVVLFSSLRLYLDSELLEGFSNVDYGLSLNKLNNRYSYNSSYDIRAVNLFYREHEIKRASKVASSSEEIKKLYDDLEYLMESFDNLDVILSGPARERSIFKSVLGKVLLALSGLGITSVTVSAENNYSFDDFNSNTDSTKGDVDKVLSCNGMQEIKTSEGRIIELPCFGDYSVAKEGNNGNFVLEPRIRTSSEFGPSVGLSFASLITKNTAGVFTVEVGADLTRIIASIGGKITPDGTLIFSGEHLEANQKFMFTSGEVEKKVKQDKYGVALRIKLTDGLLESFVASGAITKADSKQLANKEFIIDNATMFAISDNYRNIAGGTKTEVSAGFVFKTSKNGRLKLRLKQEKATWDTINSTIPSVNKTGGEATYRHANIFDSGINVELKGGTGIVGTTAGIGANVKVGPGFLGLEYNHIGGGNGMKGNDTTMLTYRTTFGGPNVHNSGKSLNSTTQAFGSIVEEVLRINQGFASQTLLHKVDEKVVNKVEVLKAGIPAGVDRLNNEGDYVVNSLNITGIASVTKDGGAFTNAGQFVINGGKLVIVTKAFAEPAVGTTNTYVATVDKSGGGQATVTVIIAKGSIKLQSVTVNDNLSTNPTVSFVNSTISKTVGDSSFTQTLTSNSPGAITYSSNNTGVATVNSTTGAVTIVGVGTAIITANQAAATGFNATNASYTLNVAAANQAPIANDGSYDAGFNGFVDIDFTSLVSDDRPISELTFELVSSNYPTWSSSGTFPNLTFIANNSGSGNSSFTYRVKDSSGVYSQIKTVTITNWSN